MIFMSLTERTAKHLDNLVLNYSKSSGVLLLVSGGSCLEVVNELKDCWNGKVTLGVVDERYSMDLNVSNFGQMKNLPFWKNVIRNRCSVINTEIREGETLGAAAARMEKQWKNSYISAVILLIAGCLDETQNE